jgi:hypothetical protein
LSRQIQGIRNVDVDDLPLAVPDGFEARLHETCVGGHLQSIDPLDDFVAQS